MAFEIFKIKNKSLKFKNLYRKTCILAPLFLRAIINVFIQLIFPNTITYLDRTFKEAQNYINFKMK